MDSCFPRIWMKTVPVVLFLSFQDSRHQHCLSIDEFAESIVLFLSFQDSRHQHCLSIDEFTESSACMFLSRKRESLQPRFMRADWKSGCRSAIESNHFLLGKRICNTLCRGRLDCSGKLVCAAYVQPKSRFPGRLDVLWLWLTGSSSARVRSKDGETL
jgi:hypothetical protein